MNNFWLYIVGWAQALSRIESWTISYQAMPLSLSLFIAPTVNARKESPP